MLFPLLYPHLFDPYHPCLFDLCVSFHCSPTTGNAPLHSSFPYSLLLLQLSLSPVPCLSLDPTRVIIPVLRVSNPSLFPVSPAPCSIQSSLSHPQTPSHLTAFYLPISHCSDPHSFPWSLLQLCFPLHLCPPFYPRTPTLLLEPSLSFYRSFPFSVGHLNPFQLC